MTDEELEREITHALAWRAERTTVHRDALNESGRRAQSPAMRPHRRRAVTRFVMAGAVAAMIVAGLVAIRVERAGAPTGSGEAATASSGPVVTSLDMTTASAVPNTGSSLLGLPADSDWTVMSAGEVSSVGSNTRIYATSADRPETGPALVVIGQPWSAGPPEPPDGSISIDVGGATGWLFGSDGRKRLTVYVDDYLYQYSAFNLTYAQLLAAAESASPSPDGRAAIIDVTTLGDGVSEQLVGWSETIFGSAASMASPLTLLTVTNATGDQATLAMFDDPDLARLDRLGGFAAITDVTIGDRPGFVGSQNGTEYESELITVVWSTGDGTATLTGDGAGTDDLLDLARSLVPISTAEWAALVEATAPPVLACAPVGDQTSDTTCVEEIVLTVAPMTADSD